MVPTGMNNSGSIVGYMEHKDPSNSYRTGFLISNDKAVDLNKLVLPNSPWRFQSANGINDSGEIFFWGGGRSMREKAATQLLKRFSFRLRVVGRGGTHVGSTNRCEVFGLGYRIAAHYGPRNIAPCTRQVRCGGPSDDEVLYEGFAVGGRGATNRGAA